ncbi:MAG: hypothetical protein V3V04_05125 [Rhizobiaceae bacterium]
MYTFFSSDIAGVSAATANMIAMGVLLLIALLVLYMLYRLIRRPRLASGRRSKNARLAITDAALIDERRKLVLVRRDDVEHLVLIGGASDLVIESNIRRNAPARPVPTAHSSTPAAAPVAVPRAPQPRPAAPVRAAAPVQVPATATAPATPPKELALPPMPPIPPVIPAVAVAGAGVAAGAAALASEATGSVKEVAASATKAPDVSIATEAKTSTSVEDMDALLDEITTS